MRKSNLNLFNLIKIGESKYNNTFCWEWTGFINKDGYGQCYFNKKTWRAHRLIFTIFRGSVHNGLECDHLCRNSKCVNPWHLDPVAHKINIQRALNFQFKSEHCKYGHPFDFKNTAFAQDFHRTCRQCQKERQRQRTGYLGNIPCKDRTHCPRGHEYNNENTYHEPKTDKRSCKICRQVYQKEYRKRKLS